ncbi:MAG: MnhB domain-containing protein [Actinomycetota bacterium]
MRGAPGLRRSLVLEVCVRLTFHAVLATALFFLFAGHNSPGGGFIGGLVAGCAFVLRYLTGGRYAPGAVRARPEAVLGTGLLVAAAAVVAPWLAGGQVLQSGYTALELPVLGYVPLASVLVFDSGVFLIVVGIVLMVLTTLGARPESSLGDLAAEPAQAEEAP